jgi:hypothetical protein
MLMQVKNRIAKGAAAGYVKPSMLYSDGINNVIPSIVSNVGGYYLGNFDNYNYAYINRGMVTTGKYCWETVVDQYTLNGVTKSLVDYNYSGYNTLNTGAYYSGLWGESYTGDLTSASIGDRLTWAYDASTRVLTIYINGVLAATSSAIAAGTYYALFSLQYGFLANQQVYLGPGNVLYPPAGYGYL